MLTLSNCVPVVFARLRVRVAILSPEVSVVIGFGLKDLLIVTGLPMAAKRMPDSKSAL